MVKVCVMVKVRVCLKGVSVNQCNIPLSDKNKCVYL